MTYGKTYILIDKDTIYNPATGELMKTLYNVRDDNDIRSWFNCTYFNDEHELRKLKFNRLKDE